MALTDARQGRVTQASIARVRERSPIEDVIGEHVTLRRAGVSLVGLCPFHDEKGPSFHVTPSKSIWHCFGCGEGGDVIAFVMKITGQSFVETLEYLAGRYSITLDYEDGATPTTQRPGTRSRIVAANKDALDFYAARLFTTEAAPARAYLAERGFGRPEAEAYELGFAPTGWDNLLRHLTSLGYTETELVDAGLVIQREATQGVYDRFRGRLIFPIRDLSNDVVGFGARKVLPDDDGPKYLNTPETLAYHKSEILYGLNMARKNIAQQREAVIVEGYTDVMAAHLSGVGTAVATCGTAFGEDHVKVLRRILHDNDMLSSKVIFTFDGDAAGQKAAMRAFKEQHKFAAATYVAVARDGMDPAELRISGGVEAVQSLIKEAVPLIQFVLRTLINQHNLTTVEGRANALRAAAPAVAALEDEALSSQYMNVLGGWLGLSPAVVRQAVRTAHQSTGAAPTAPQTTPDAERRPDPTSLPLLPEREALKVALQAPDLTPGWDDILEDGAFSDPMYARVWEVWKSTMGQDTAARLNVAQKQAADPVVAGMLTELMVEAPLGPLTAEYSSDVLGRLLDRIDKRQIDEAKVRVATATPGTDAYNEAVAALLKHARPRSRK